MSDAPTTASPPEPGSNPAVDPLDFSLDALEQRHLDRRATQVAAVAAEVELRRTLEADTPKPTSWWARVRQRWSAAPSEAGPEAVAARYEATLRSVRALGFHMLALEDAVRQATLDAEACMREALRLGGESTRAASAEARSRLLVTLGRAEALAPLVEAEADLLREHHATLVELHGAANDVVQALGRQALATAAGTVHARDAATVDAVVRRAVERAAELHHRADEHEARLAHLDAEARARLAARAEVEGWLSPGHRP